MKTIHLTIYASLFLLAAAVTSCTQNNEIIKYNPEEGMPVSATIDTRAIPSTLDCTLYIFWKSAVGDPYTCKEVVSLTAVPEILRFTNAELKDKYYRFFFVAVPAVNSYMSVVNTGGTPLAAGDNWSDVLLRTQAQVLDVNYYYDIVDETGNDLLANGTITGTLERVVGQLVLDIFKIGNEIGDPIDVDPARATSVLDRVYEIQVEYTNLTKDIGFDADGTIIEKATWGATPVTQTIQVDRDASLRVSPTQPDNGISPSGQPAEGSVRINGICGLLANQKIRAKYTFKYFDTTPICENNHTGAHTESCFDNTQSLTLHLPEEVNNNFPLLSIQPNYFTVSKAGIRLDRIIDIKYTGSFVLNTQWANERVPN